MTDFLLPTLLSRPVRRIVLARPEPAAYGAATIEGNRMVFAFTSIDKVALSDFEVYKNNEPVNVVVTLTVNEDSTPREWFFELLSDPLSTYRARCCASYGPLKSEWSDFVVINSQHTTPVPTITADYDAATVNIVCGEAPYRYTLEVYHDNVLVDTLNGYPSLFVTRPEPRGVFVHYRVKKEELGPQTLYAASMWSAFEQYYFANDVVGAKDPYVKWQGLGTVSGRGIEVEWFANRAIVSTDRFELELKRLSDGAIQTYTTTSHAAAFLFDNLPLGQDYAIRVRFVGSADWSESCFATTCADRPEYYGYEALYSSHLLFDRLKITPNTAAGTSLIEWNGSDANAFPFRFSWPAQGAEIVILKGNANAETCVQGVENGNYIPCLTTARYAKVIEVLSSRAMIVDFAYNGGNRVNPVVTEAARGYVFINCRAMWQTILADSSVPSVVRFRANKVYVTKSIVGANVAPDMSKDKLLTSDHAIQRSAFKMSMEAAYRATDKHGWAPSTSAIANSFLETYGSDQGIRIPIDYTRDIGIARINMYGPFETIPSAQYQSILLFGRLYNDVRTNYAPGTYGRRLVEDCDTLAERDECISAGKWSEDYYALAPQFGASICGGGLNMAGTDLAEDKLQVFELKASSEDAGLVRYQAYYGHDIKNNAAVSNGGDGHARVTAACSGNVFKISGLAGNRVQFGGTTHTPLRGSFEFGRVRAIDAYTGSPKLEIHQDDNFTVWPQIAEQYAFGFSFNAQRTSNILFEVDGHWLPYHAAPRINSSQLCQTGNAKLLDNLYYRMVPSGHSGAFWYMQQGASHLIYNHGYFDTQANYCPVCRNLEPVNTNNWAQVVRNVAVSHVDILELTRYVGGGKDYFWIETARQDTVNNGNTAVARHALRLQVFRKCSVDANGIPLATLLDPVVGNDVMYNTYRGVTPNTIPYVVFRARLGDALAGGTFLPCKYMGEAIDGGYVWYSSGDLNWDISYADLSGYFRAGYQLDTQLWEVANHIASGTPNAYYKNWWYPMFCKWVGVRAVDNNFENVLSGNELKNNYKEYTGGIGLMVRHLLTGVEHRIVFDGGQDGSGYMLISNNTGGPFSLNTPNYAVGELKKYCRAHPSLPNHGLCVVASLLMLRNRPIIPAFVKSHGLIVSDSTGIARVGYDEPAIFTLHTVEEDLANGAERHLQFGKIAFLPPYDGGPYGVAFAGRGVITINEVQSPQSFTPGCIISVGRDQTSGANLPSPPSNNTVYVRILAGYTALQFFGFSQEDKVRLSNVWLTNVLYNVIPNYDFPQGNKYRFNGYGLKTLYIKQRPEIVFEHTGSENIVQITSQSPGAYDNASVATLLSGTGTDGSKWELLDPMPNQRIVVTFSAPPSSAAIVDCNGTVRFPELIDGVTATWAMIEVYKELGTALLPIIRFSYP